MDLFTQVFIAVGFFLAIKAVEYSPTPTGPYTFCSIGAWVAFVVGIVLWLIP